MAGSSKLSAFGTVVFWTFRILWTSIVIVVPTLGVWVGSSIAAYLNGPVWLVCVAGLLLFPLLPLAWDWVAQLRAKPQKKWERRVLTFWDRLVLRTLAINLTFLTVLLWVTPQTAFTALSARGDWILDDIEHPGAAKLRPWFFRTAEGLAWLYEISHDNEYVELIDPEARASDVDPTPAPVDEDDPWRNPWERRPSSTDEADADERAEELDRETEPDSDEPEPQAEPIWPRDDGLHPMLAQMPASAASTVESAGRWIAAHESDPHLRVKAIHDFVADRVAYDAAALAAGHYPPQDAETVLRTGLAVCAGYANLTKALADVTGDQVVVVSGDARTRGGKVSGNGHAWNAVYLEDQWLLMDVTWDAGYVDGDQFVKRYSTSYLFTPPAVMGVTHFPDDAKWQLVERPLSRGEFLRQPMMRPRFFAQGFYLVSPQRSQVTVEDQVSLALENPQGRFLLAKYEDEQKLRRGDCEVRNGPEPEVQCDFPGAGTWSVKLFSSPERYGRYQWIGEIQAHSRS